MINISQLSIYKQFCVIFVLPRRLKQYLSKQYITISELARMSLLYSENKNTVYMLLSIYFNECKNIVLHMEIIITCRNTTKKLPCYIITSVITSLVQVCPHYFGFHIWRHLVHKHFTGFVSHNFLHLFCCLMNLFTSIKE